MLMRKCVHGINIKHVQTCSFQLQNGINIKHVLTCSFQASLLKKKRERRKQLALE